LVIGPGLIADDVQDPDPLVSRSQGEAAKRLHWKIAAQNLSDRKACLLIHITNDNRPLVTPDPAGDRTFGRNLGGRLLKRGLAGLQDVQSHDVLRLVVEHDTDRLKVENLI